ETNAWIANQSEDIATVQMQWDKSMSIRSIKLFFDPDYDHALESTLMEHPESIMPFIINDYQIEDGNGNILKKVIGNYQAINTITFDQSIKTNKLVFKFFRSQDLIPVSIFNISVYE
ncbi:MAG: hypothetical protein RIR48_332, partial [Bacteroidota bacterium]